MSLNKYLMKKIRNTLLYNHNSRKFNISAQTKMLVDVFTKGVITFAVDFAEYNIYKNLTVSGRCQAFSWGLILFRS